MSLSYRENGEKMRKSIIDQEKVCYECGSTQNLHLHHIFYGRNHKLCDKDKILVYLCLNHHTGREGVHNGNTKLDLKLKQMGQRAFMEYYGKTLEEFRERYGINYL